MTMFDRIVEVMRNETGETVKLDTKLREVVSDSLEMANLVLELEGVLGIEIPEEDLCRLFTVQDVLSYAKEAA